MERGEDEASDQYDKIASEVSEAKKIAAEDRPMNTN
jgi:hypothetical protein